MFCISMFWPGMVLNQGQLSIVISDWESYLGSLFSFCILSVVEFVSGLYSPSKLHVRTTLCSALLSEAEQFPYQSIDATRQDALDGAAVKPFQDLRTHAKPFQSPERE